MKRHPKNQVARYLLLGNQKQIQSLDSMIIAETDDCILMVETKSTQHKNVDDSWNEEVTEKARSGIKWCSNATNYLKSNGGKEWRYLLIPHDEVKEANTLDSYATKFCKQ